MKLFFDTETSGIPLNYNAPITNIANWPRLVQIGWITYDDLGNERESLEAIIKPMGFEIPEHVSKVHGITTEQALQHGVDLDIILKQFAAVCEKSDSIIGHNIDFDINVMGAEYIRAGMTSPLEGKPRFDTMKLATNYCQIPGGARGYKWPKLSELYFKLFQTDMGHAHTALADIQNTAKCFYQLCSLGVIQTNSDTSKVV